VTNCAIENVRVEVFLKRKKCKPIRISVMRTQSMTVEQLVKCYTKMQEGEIIFVSIYCDNWSRIGLKSDELKKFVKRKLDENISITTKMMRKFSKGWYDADEELSEEKKLLDQEAFQATSPPGFHSSKMS
jgi:hypothetical protein